MSIMGRFVPATLDEHARTVEGTIASEAPVEVFDLKRGQVIPEILLRSGMTIRNGDSAPLLDAHDRGSIRSVLGSVDRIGQGSSFAGLTGGRLRFDSAPKALRTFMKVRDGHVTDLSAGYRVLEGTYIPAGSSKSIEGRNFTGPVNVQTKWELAEVSVVPIGADWNAKIRSVGDAPALRANEMIFSRAGGIGRRCLICPRTLCYDPATFEFALMLGSTRLEGRALSDPVRDLLRSRAPGQSEYDRMGRLAGALLKDLSRDAKHAQIREILSTRDMPPYALSAGAPLPIIGGARQESEPPSPGASEGEDVLALFRGMSDDEARQLIETAVSRAWRL